jgi:neutral trehalase
MDKNHDLLMEEGFYAGWADSLRKKGTVLYTNVLHFRAVENFSKICKALNKREDYAHYKKLAEEIKKKINELFWNGEYYNDWISPKKHHTYFSTDGNVIAILFGVASHEQGVKIQNCIQRFGLDSGFTTGTNFPKYEWKHIYPFFFPLRIPDYHNGLQWLWLGCIDAVTKNMVGMKTQAKDLLAEIARKILEYKGVYEVYHLGKPVRRLFYKSEQGFAWSSGLFVWACKEVGLK